MIPKWRQTWKISSLWKQVINHDLKLSSLPPGSLSERPYENFERLHRVVPSEAAMLSDCEQQIKMHWLLLEEAGIS